MYNARERQKESMLERVMGSEPTTFCLGSQPESLLKTTILAFQKTG